MADAATAAAEAAQACLKLQAQFGPNIDCNTALTLLSVGHLDFMSPYQRHIICVFQMVTVFCATLLISEWLNFLPREIWLVRKSRLSSGILALLLNRYIGLMAVVTGVIFNLANPSSCTAVGWLFCLTFAIQQGAAAYIFLLRTRAIWDNSKTITIVMGVGCVLVTGTFFASLWSVKYTTTPAELTPYGGRCIVGGKVLAWRAVASCVALAYDTLTLILTIVGLMGYTVDVGKSQKIHRTVRKLAEASLWYFVPVFCVNVSTVVIIFTTNHDIRAIAMAYSGTVATIAASRMVFDMQTTFGIRDRHSEKGDAMAYMSGSDGTMTASFNLAFQDPPSRDATSGGTDNNTNSNVKPEMGPTPVTHSVAMLPYSVNRPISPITSIPFSQEQVTDYSPRDWPISKS